MQIGICTDLHLGIRQYGLEERENDFYDQYNKAIDLFISNDVDIVIFAGDIFDKPRPSPKALRIFSNGLDRLISNKIEVLNIVGNHAMVQSPEFVTADEFLETLTGFQDHYMTLNKEKYYISDDVFIAGLPYAFQYQMTDFIDAVSFLNAMCDTSKTNILVLHQSFKEFCGFTGEPLSINDIDVSNFDLVICGHIHEKKLIEISNKTVFLQPGSLERSSVAEARDEEHQGKGIFILNTDYMNIESISAGFIPIHSDRKFLIMNSSMDKKDDILIIEKEIREYIKQCSVAPILFLTVHDISQSFTQLMDLTKELKHDCLTVHFNYFDENPIEYDGNVLSDASDIPTPREALKIAVNPLDEKEANLAMDLYELLKDGKDATELLNDFYKKNIKHDVEPKEYLSEDFNELINFFEKI